MRNREAFKKIKDYVDSNNVTRTQVESATTHQLASVTGISEKEIGPYLDGIKRLILEDMTEAEELQQAGQIKLQAKNWLDPVYPDHEETIQRVDGKLGVTIWPFGKPGSM